MANYVIFNSKCSKCNKTKEYIENSSLKFEFIHYLEGELTKEILEHIYHAIEDKKSLVREGDFDTLDDFKSLISSRPEVLQRPIIIMDKTVFINRPAEILLDKLEQDA